ncbi:DMT family transporter [Paenibacillus oralis]|uniref:DMT family transporter n=1 Tax=Paenibacillus oralis TaxID=2490856 RepID=A0A3P3U4N2_9BACL|nr:DMT family transporter [Paenibacillus oralis]RRJ65120.1 DMT family transporter [Paenibacillus oralis]
MARPLYFALIMLSLIWGGSFFFIKILLPDYGPWVIAFLRSIFGLATISAMMLILRKPFAIRNIHWLQMAVMALVNTAIPWAFIGFSEMRLTSAVASVLNSTTPLWTLAVGVLFFHVVAGRRQWLGMGVAFIGIIVLLGVSKASIVSVDGFGLACMLAATLCYAFGSHLSKKLSEGLSMYQVAFGTLLCATLGSGVMAAATEDVSLVPLASPTTLGAVIGLGVFGSGFAYILFYFMVQKGSPQFAISVTYLVPVSAIIWGFTLLHEPISWRLVAGLVFILGGVYLTNKSGARAARLSKTGGKSYEI